MSGRAASTSVRPGDYALSVGMPDKPVPPGWKWVSLLDVAEMATGHTPSRNYPDYWENGDIPWVTATDARPVDGGVINDTGEKINRLGLANSAAVLLPEGTVCLSRTGASIGYTVILGRPMATNQGFVNWICRPALNNRYLLHLFMAERRALFSFGEGSAHATIYFPEVKAFHICLPPRPEQDRIVAKIEELLSDLDAGVAALERARANLKKYRAAVLKAAVTGELTADWRAAHPHAEPASKLLDRILAERRRQWEANQQAKFTASGKTPPKGWQAKYPEPVQPDATDLPELPPGWCWATLDQLNRAERPISYGVLQPGADLTEGIPLVRVCDVADGMVDESQLKRISSDISANYKRTILEGAEVLLTIVGTIGRTAVAPPSLRGANTARAVAVIPVMELLPARYVEITLRESGMRKRLTEAAHEVARKTLNLEDVRRACIPLPPLVEQAVIISEVEERLSIIAATENYIAASLKRAGRLRQSILKEAFAGRLVPQDPTDEPACVLLDRIRQTRHTANGTRPARSRRPRRGVNKSEATDGQP